MADRRVAIISKPGRPELETIIPRLTRQLNDSGFDVVGDEETSAYSATVDVCERSDLGYCKPEFVIVLGGDGTLLAAARAVAQLDIPILAVNLGSLGFLTEVRVEELDISIKAAIEGRCIRDARTMIACDLVRRDQKISSFFALNDVVVTKSAIARLLEVEVFVDAEFVANYKADGVIISTPTGSTAYSLAAGGPVLVPSVDAFIVTPVSPHALTHRPLVVRDSSEIVLLVKGSLDEVILTIDGQTPVQALEGDKIVCRRSAKQVHLLRVPGRTFFEVLRTKLKWGER
jgi:NAD+ kinase